VRRVRLLLCLVLAACAATLALAVASAAETATATDALNAPATNDECFRCHGSADVRDVTVDAGGEQKSIYVNREVYERSRHGRLACTSCHIGFEPGQHDAEQTEGWLETAKISACRSCHADVFSMYRGSFHGNLVFGESSGEAPVCADCHEAHNIVPPESVAFRRQIDGLCAQCHEDALRTYLDSYHGKASTLGDLETAVCTDCHGGHRILAASDPESSVNEANLIETCGDCHPGANDNFVQFMVHVDPRSPSSSFLVFTFYAAYVALITVVFTFGFVHSGLYIYRGYKDGLYKRNHHG
jgi:predicted CXXCH cytochrome family protein